MTDDDREVLNKFYREEHEKIAKQESEKAFLKDKMIGGDALRPSDDFIDQNLGKQKTDREMVHEANIKAEERFKQYQAKQLEQQEQQFKKELENSNRPKVANEFNKKSRPKRKNIFKKQNQNNRDMGRTR